MINTLNILYYTTNTSAVTLKNATDVKSHNKNLSKEYEKIPELIAKINDDAVYNKEMLKDTNQYIKSKNQEIQTEKLINYKKILEKVYEEYLLQVKEKIEKKNKN